MNNVQITKILKKELKRTFKGVYPIDKLLKIKRGVPAAIVVNTDESFRSGRHWLAIYIEENGTGYFFDSFGRRPEGRMGAFLDSRCEKWYFCEKMVQNPVTGVCGGYCIWFLVYFHYKRNVRGFYNLFSSNLLKNDRKVVNYIENEYGVEIMLFPSLRFKLK